ncbi:hypothetical protein Nepgr_009336 [Nepenthes gracilis]|uniref:Uncharacterized protein n=1 Tax=Nepenthes gracilis TaxID=150966 RepID=A0AAD3SAN9_NEPGR|nr:hypothetical protein Nepgr_009336 [Nepenthes gracilis]
MPIPIFEKKESQIPSSMTQFGVHERDATPRLLDSCRIVSSSNNVLVPLPSSPNKGLRGVSPSDIPSICASASLMAPLGALCHSRDPIPRWMLDHDDVGDSLHDNRAIPPSWLAFSPRRGSMLCCSCNVLRYSMEHHLPFKM